MAFLRIQVPRTTRHVHILHPGLLASHMFICGGTVYYYVSTGQILLELYQNILPSTSEEEDMVLL